MTHIENEAQLYLQACPESTGQEAYVAGYRKAREELLAILVQHPNGFGTAYLVSTWTAQDLKRLGEEGMRID